MAFQSGGIINRVNYPQGAHVNAGDIVVSLNTNSLQAQLAQAQANVDTQKANLASLQAGATQQDIQVSQTAVATAQQALANDYANVPSTVTQAYSEANDAVRNQLSSLFSTTNWSQVSNPTLTFQVSDSNVSNTVDTGLTQVSTELNQWQAELQSVNSNSSTSTLYAVLSDASSRLSAIQSFLIEMMVAVNDSRGLSTNTTTYQTYVTTATNEVNTAITSINTLAQGNFFPRNRSAAADSGAKRRL